MCDGDQLVPNRLDCSSVLGVVDISPNSSPASSDSSLINTSDGSSSVSSCDHILSSPSLTTESHDEKSAADSPLNTTSNGAVSEPFSAFSSGNGISTTITSLDVEEKRGSSKLSNPELPNSTAESDLHISAFSETFQALADLAPLLSSWTSDSTLTSSSSSSSSEEKLLLHSEECVEISHHKRKEKETVDPCERKKRRKNSPQGRRWKFHLSEHEEKAKDERLIKDVASQLANIGWVNLAAFIRGSSVKFGLFKV
jgi:hypothetical protein